MYEQDKIVWIMYTDKIFPKIYIISLFFSKETLNNNKMYQFFMEEKIVNKFVN